MNRIVLICIAGFVGIIAPFVIANRVVDRIYNPDILGTPPPTAPVLIGYGVALVVAILVFVISAKAIRQDHSPLTQEEAQVEELPD